jgi:hypothetical protein
MAVFAASVKLVMEMLLVPSKKVWDENFDPRHSICCPAVN